MYDPRHELIGVGDDVASHGKPDNFRGEEPYVIKNGKYLIGACGFHAWCDAINELWEYCIEPYMRFAIIRFGNQFRLWEIEDPFTWDLGVFQDIRPLYLEKDGSTKVITHFRVKYTNGDDGLFDVNHLGRDLLKE